MAYSKSTLFPALALAFMLLIASHVSARELAEASQTQVEDAKNHGFGHGHGHGKPGHGFGHGKLGHGFGHGKPGHGKGPGKPGHGKPGHGAAETESDEN